jgi:hypothetical protein
VERFESAEQKRRMQTKDAFSALSQTTCRATLQRCSIFSSEKHLQAYRIGTINTRLAILRQYGRPTHEAGIIADEDLELLLSVKGYSAKIGRNIDADRVRQTIPTRKSTKKATPTPLTTSQGLRLKTTTTPSQTAAEPAGPELGKQRCATHGALHRTRPGRERSRGTQYRVLRSGAGTVTVYRGKTDETQIHRLKKHTRLAAEDYLAATGRRSGPLFLVYGGKRITRYGLYDRVRLLPVVCGLGILSCFKPIK